MPKFNQHIETILRHQHLGKLTPEEKWNDLHFVTIAIVASICIISDVVLMCAHFFLRISMGMPINTYLSLMIFVPAAINFFLLTTAFIVRWNTTDIRNSALMASLITPLIIAVYYVTHSRFTSVELAFLLPIMITIGYADIGITNITAVITIGLKLVSDMTLINVIAGGVPRLTGSMDSKINEAVFVGLVLLTWALSLLFMVAERSKIHERENYERSKQKLYKKTITDTMTGIGNRAALRLVFDFMLKDSTGRKYCLAMTDIDHFKSINDTFGHDVGDMFIKGLAETLRLVQNAEPFRFGGDEFCIILFDRTKEQAAQICEELIELFGFIPAAHQYRKATVSFGIAEWDGKTAPADFLKQADEALYEAKKERGCVRIYNG